jgi:putative transposase
VSPARRRRAVEHLQQVFGVSQRWACQLVGQHRSTQRHQPAEPDRDRALREELRRLSRAHPRWGYRRAHAVLREQGWTVNRKAIQRLWREEGLRVPTTRRKRQRLGISTCPADRLAAEHPDHVWALDYQFDQTLDGRILKLLNIVDEHTREALTIQVDRRIDADATVAVLDRLVDERGAVPRFIRCDIHAEWRADRACGSGRPRRFISNRRSSVTAAIAIGAAWVDSLPVDRGGGRGPRRRGAVALLGT